MSDNSSDSLRWPAGWPRARAVRISGFSKQRTLAQAREFTLRQLRLLGVPPQSVVISSNIQARADGLPRSGLGEPRDRGVAVYFTLAGAPRVMACDRWVRVTDNLYAIGKHVEAIRAQARYGVGTVQRALDGYLEAARSSAGVEHVPIEVEEKATRLLSG